MKKVYLPVLLICFLCSTGCTDPDFDTTYDSVIRQQDDHTINPITGALLVLLIIGGITRLTGSGLSMTDWKPLWDPCRRFPKQNGKMCDAFAWISFVAIFSAIWVSVMITWYWFAWLYYEIRKTAKNDIPIYSDSSNWNLAW